VNGVLYAFDYGNRLRSIAGLDAYRYDAWGRRVRQSNTAGPIYSLYGRDGSLLWQRNERTGQRRNYVYLQGSLLAEDRLPLVGSTETITYQHTDALGTPVATTNAGKAVLQTSEYEPYGKLLNRPMEDGPDYTGHVSDAGSKLVYMQQRYYDPRTGRFWSTDPVTAYEQPIASFNRYRYANNNPYKFTDPDGRQSARIDPEMTEEQRQAALNERARREMQGSAFGASVIKTAETTAKAMTEALDTSLSAVSAAAQQKVGDFSGSGIIKRWEGATKAEVKLATKIGKLSQGVSLVGMGASAWEFRTARNSGDTSGMISAGTGFGFSAIGLTPWGAPGSIAFGATSAVMDTPLGQQFAGKLADGMCTASGNC
jgi:RHS repeat-associated protein